MAVENQSVLNYSLFTTAALIWFLLYLFFGYMLQMPGINGFVAQYADPAGKILPFVLGMAGAGGSLYAARRNEQVNTFGLEVVVELKKVVWPTRKEVTGSTSATLVVIFIVAIILFTFDKIFGWLIALLVQ